MVGGDRIPSVEVKFLDIRRNTGGEGDHLGHKTSNQLSVISNQVLHLITDY